MVPVLYVKSCGLSIESPFFLAPDSSPLGQSHVRREICASNIRSRHFSCPALCLANNLLTRIRRRDSSICNNNGVDVAPGEAALDQRRRGTGFVSHPSSFPYPKIAPDAFDPPRPTICSVRNPFDVINIR